MSEELENLDRGKKLFTDPQYIEQFSQFAKRLNRIESEDSSVEKKLTLLKSSFRFFLSNGQLFDEHCQFNIHHLKSHVISLINYEDDKIISSIDDIYATFYRFLTEYEFSTPGEISFEFSQLLSQFRSAIEDIDINDERRQIFYASFYMPVQIAKFYLKSKELNSVENFLAKIDQFETKKKSWDDDLTIRESRASVLADKLKNYESEFNFVGLYKGFDQIGKQKNGEKDTLRIILIFVGIIILVPLLAESIYIFCNRENIDRVHQTLLYLIAPTASLELILIYFFRVFLANYKSVKTQLLQIDLRKSLCQFVQSYGDYSSELKNKNGAVLEKFENLIFSGIIASEDKLPSTFDGLDQISNIIKALKTEH